MVTQAQWNTLVPIWDMYSSFDIISYVLPGTHITAGWEASLVNTRL